MNLLLDTHIVLWALSDDPKLSAKARNMILDANNNIYYSSVSAWEVLLKSTSSKNNNTFTTDDFVQYCDEAGYYCLSLDSEHIRMASHLDVTEAEKNGHKDPFDRLLLAQAKAENYLFLTHDDKMKYYHERCIVLV